MAKTQINIEVEENIHIHFAKLAKQADVNLNVFVSGFVTQKLRAAIATMEADNDI